MTAERKWTPPPERFEAKITCSRFGYYAHCSYGICMLGESGGIPFAFTLRGIRRKVLRGIRRKVARLKRKVERDHQPPVEVIR